MQKTGHPTRAAFRIPSPTAQSFDCSLLYYYSFLWLTANKYIVPLFYAYKQRTPSSRFDAETLVRAFANEPNDMAVGIGNNQLMALFED